MRNLKELYEIVLENFDYYIGKGGICNISNQLSFYEIITIQESILLDGDIEAQTGAVFTYAWPRTPAGNIERKEFIKKRINEL
jgi:hypothetical protein